MRGDVDIAFEFYAAVSGLMDEKKLVALASTGPKRSAYLPDVPTVLEGGIAGFEVMSSNRISAPAATPPAVVQVLARAINEVLPIADVQERGRKLGLDLRGSTPEEMTARLQADIAKWGAVIEKAGIARRD